MFSNVISRKLEIEKMKPYKDAYVRLFITDVVWITTDNKLRNDGKVIATFAQGDVYYRISSVFFCVVHPQQYPIRTDICDAQGWILKRYDNISVIGVADENTLVTTKGWHGRDTELFDWKTGAVRFSIFQHEAQFAIQYTPPYIFKVNSQGLNIYENEKEIQHYRFDASNRIRYKARFYHFPQINRMVVEDGYRIYFYATDSYGVPYDRLWWYGIIHCADVENAILVYSNDSTLRCVDVLNPRIKPGRQHTFKGENIYKVQLVGDYYLVQTTEAIHWILRQS